MTAVGRKQSWFKYKCFPDAYKWYKIPANSIWQEKIGEDTSTQSKDILLHEDAIWFKKSVPPQRKDEKDLTGDIAENVRRNLKAKNMKAEIQKKCSVVHVRCGDRDKQNYVPGPQNALIKAKPWHISCPMLPDERPEEEYFRMPQKYQPEVDDTEGRTIFTDGANQSEWLRSSLGARSDLVFGVNLCSYRLTYVSDHNEA
ncbi:hypothetical protein Tco_0446196 [Tanacetum coccineum]